MNINTETKPVILQDKVHVDQTNEKKFLTLI